MISTSQRSAGKRDVCREESLDFETVFRKPYKLAPSPSWQIIQLNIKQCLTKNSQFNLMIYVEN
jgi:hypothetical protein